VNDVYEHGEDDYVCPFCLANCGPDYSDYSDHIHDEHEGDGDAGPS
jgi:hypothetical protein